eukprot:7341197-Alexandrium_andersonii.AAC.1
MVLGQSFNSHSERWASYAGVGALQMGRAESDAASNLAQHCDPAFVAVLEKAAKKYGVVRGPITHDAIASHFVRLNDGPSCPTSSYWEMSMKNSPESLLLMAQRVVKDWEDAPSGLRHSLAAKDMPQYQVLSAGFAFMLREFQAKVPSAVYEDTKDGLIAKFLKKYADAEIEDEWNRKANPLDLYRVGIFATVLAQNTQADEAEKKRHDEELSNRLAQATLEQMTAYLHSDQQAIDAYRAAIVSAKSDFATRAK